MDNNPSGATDMTRPKVTLNEEKTSGTVTETTPGANCITPRPFLEISKSFPT